MQEGFQWVAASDLRPRVDLVAEQGRPMAEPVEPAAVDLLLVEVLLEALENDLVARVQYTMVDRANISSKVRQDERIREAALAI